MNGRSAFKNKTLNQEQYNDNNEGFLGQNGPKMRLKIVTCVTDQIKHTTTQSKKLTDFLSMNTVAPWHCVRIIIIVFKYEVS